MGEREGLEAVVEALTPPGRYRTIVADPPWPFDWNRRCGLQVERLAEVLLNAGRERDGLPPAVLVEVDDPDHYRHLARATLAALLDREDE